MAVKKSASGYSVFHSFKDLENVKGLIRKALPQLKPASLKDHPGNDAEVFLSAMKDVREICEFTRLPLRRNKPVKARKRPDPDREALQHLEAITKGSITIALSDTQEYVEWINKNYYGLVAQELHAGRYSVQDTLDLHGAFLVDADTLLREFINHCMRKRYRCVKIIHGRGLRSPNGPVLKNAVTKWLSGRYRKHVISFVSARQCDGGLGALYVLLK